MPGPLKLDPKLQSKYDKQRSKSDKKRQKQGEFVINSLVEIDRNKFVQMDRETCKKVGGNPELKIYCRELYESLLNKKLTIIDFLNDNIAKVKYIDDSGEIKEKFVQIKCLRNMHYTYTIEENPYEENPYFIMDNGAKINNISDFLDNAKLNQYEKLSNIMNLSLDEIKDITDEDLFRYGIDKEFHRLRFLRHARKMKPIPLFGGNKKKKHKSKKKKRKSKKNLHRKRKYIKKNKLSKRKMN